MFLICSDIGWGAVLWLRLKGKEVWEGAGALF